MSTIYITCWRYTTITASHVRSHNIQKSEPFFFQQQQKFGSRISCFFFCKYLSWIFNSEVLFCFLFSCVSFILLKIQLTCSYLVFVCFSVDAWAEEFGKELYEMAKTMTKVKEIKDVSIFVWNSSGQVPSPIALHLFILSSFAQKYQQYNAEVVDKGDLIQDAVENVGRMFRRKIVAVRVSSRSNSHYIMHPHHLSHLNI